MDTENDQEVLMVSIYDGDGDSALKIAWAEINLKELAKNKN